MTVPCRLPVIAHYRHGCGGRSMTAPTNNRKASNHWENAILGKLKCAALSGGTSDYPCISGKVMRSLRFGLRCVGSTQPSVTVMVPIVVLAGVLLSNAPVRVSAAEPLGAFDTGVLTAVARLSVALSKLPRMLS